MPKSANVSTKAKAKGSSKIGGTSGGSGWSQPWSRAQALAELCVPPKAYEAAQNLRQRIEVELDEALAGRDVSFEWVRGHAGHPLNEAADLRARYAAGLENMEGFAVAYACARMGIACVGIRSVSNKVGPRAQDEKDFPGALAALTRVLPALNLI